MKGKRFFPKQSILFVSALSFILFSSLSFGAITELIAPTATGTATITPTYGTITTNTIISLRTSGVGSITLTANPTSIPANGSSSTTITATIKDGAGNPVRHYTEVVFTTNLGHFRDGGSSYTMKTQPPLGKDGFPDPDADPTGIAEVQFIADATPGSAKITASAVNTSQILYVYIGGEPVIISLTAAPTSILADGANSATITATLKDSTGTPVAPGTAVTFSTNLGTFSGGGTTLTDTTPDNTGIVSVSLISETTSGLATVTATANGTIQALMVGFTGATASTGTATSVSSTSATLNGTVNPNGVSTAVTFEYGTTTGYGNTITATESPLTGTTAQSVSASITSLIPGTTYHVRVKATSFVGTIYGDDQNFTTSAFGATINVPGDQPTIQAGIDAASDGDMVLVSPGTYVEFIDFKGKAVTVASLFLITGNKSYISSTVIDGSNAATTPVIRNTGNASNYTLYGLSIVNAPQTAIRIDSGFPVIKYCNFTDSGTPGIWGAIGIYSNATIENCEFRRNSGRYVVLADVNCSLKISFKNCVFSRNIAAGSWEHNSVILLSSTTLENCLFVENDGNVIGVGGNSNCISKVVNTTIANNNGYGLDFVHWNGVYTFILYNSIVAFNDPQEIRLTNTLLGATTTIYNSLIKGGVSYLTIPQFYKFNYDNKTNIETDPLFVDLANGNYYLQAGSPCIDSGTSEGAPSTDIDGIPRPQGAGYDMGAYERRIEAIIRIPSDYSTIQAGINAASNGATVLVADGTYVGEGNKNLDFRGKAITVKSENGANSCIIDCEGSGQGFYFHSGEGVDSLLSGFTITNGNAIYGGGIACWYSSSPTIAGCIIEGNTATNSGGGIACKEASSPTIIGCTIKGNIAGSWGGGIHCEGTSSPAITNCVIFENEVLGLGNGGGGISCYPSCSPLIMNCTITGNTVSDKGGGVFSHELSSPTIVNSIIWGNTPNEMYGTSVGITYSDVQGGYSGESNIASDPLFASSDNYRLTANSPCIDAGTSNGAPATDLAGNSRPQGAGYDMGAYEFVSSSSPPSVSTDVATSATSSSATLNGTVNPNGTSTTVTFEYGTSSSYGSTVTATQSPLTGTNSQNVSVGVTGLATGTTYHFRVRGTNSAGTTNGDDQTFTTTSGPPVAAPTVTTGSGSAVTSTSATLNGTVNPNGSTTTYYFEYGTTASYGASTSSTSAGSGTSDVSANATITGLTSETTYHYRVVAMNSSGTSLGADDSFVTSSLKPSVGVGSGNGTRADKITLPITLTNISGTDIAAVSVDIEYDTSIFEKPKAKIGPSGDTADKTVATSEPAFGVFRVTVFSVSNNNVIGNGVVAYLTLNILANAPGIETTLTNTPSASGPSGNDVGVESSDSTVAIIGFLAGDCNGDGTVSIAEVQSAINMYLKIIPVEKCVDVNGNGKVSIGEVQKVINNHLDASLASDYTNFGPGSNISTEGIVNRLMNARSSNSVPLLDIGSSTGEPGKTVTVPVSLANASGYNVSAISCDISYDTGIFEDATVAIGPAGSSAGKSVTSNEISTGVLRIGVLSASNSNVIGDGVVIYLTFRVKAGASLGQTPLGNSPEASDPSGNDVSIEGSNGVIRIAPAVYVQASGSCGGNTPCYSTIQAAIDAAVTENIIRILQGNFDEDIIIDQSYYLILSGGWDSTFTTQTSDTVINSLTIVGTGGAVEIENVVLE
jgi:parallel beta-helix repeat protein